MRVMPTGKVEVLTGSHSHGQGHETAFAQVVADELQVPMERRRHRAWRHRQDAVRLGHLRQPQRGRSGASAIKLAADKIRDKATRIAAHLLEAAPETSSTWTASSR